MREIDQQSSQGVGKAGTGLRRVAPAEPVQLTPTRRVRLVARAATFDHRWLTEDGAEVAGKPEPSQLSLASGMGPPRCHDLGTTWAWM